MTRQTSASPLPPTVVIVDDEATVRESLDSLLRSVGLRTLLFASPAELLRASVPDGPGCLVLDVRLPGTSGLDFQDQLSKNGIELPIVFMTGHGDIPMSVRAMKAGAVDFLTKPFDQQQLLAAVRAAIEKDRTARAARAARSSIGVRVAALTPREHQVMAHVVSGHLNKQIAAELGIAEKTVKVHRARVMKKMDVASVAELVSDVTKASSSG
jgi:FixJ family two-component response regulator